MRKALAALVGAVLLTATLVIVAAPAQSSTSGPYIATYTVTEDIPVSTCWPFYGSPTNCRQRAFTITGVKDSADSTRARWIISGHVEAYTVSEDAGGVNNNDGRTTWGERSTYEADVWCTSPSKFRIFWSQPVLATGTRYVPGTDYESWEQDYENDTCDVFEWRGRWDPKVIQQSASNGSSSVITRTRGYGWNTTGATTNLPLVWQQTLGS